jgi:hypothetical protein
MAIAAPRGGVMSQIPPLAYVVVQNVQTQRDAAVEKERQLRQKQETDVAAQEDTFEHHVESAKEVHPVNDENEKKKPNRHPKPGHGKHASDEDGEMPHLDLTA